MTKQKQNAEVLTAELKWLSAVIDTRFKIQFAGDKTLNVQDIVAPDLSANESVYANIVRHYKMNIAERLIFILSIAPHIQPQILDPFFLKNSNTDRGFTEIGGLKGKNFSGFIPTGETAVFILAGDDLNLRFTVAQIFDKDHYFNRMNILTLSSLENDEPVLSGAIQITDYYINYVTKGDFKKPDYSIDFPAKLLTTPLSWDDLILDSTVMEELNEINSWIKHGETLMQDWGLDKKMKKGFRALFYGPPGTGKTLTASLLGKVNGLDAYKIDLSAVVSKYIGETEKNLAKIFDAAEISNWILFFDEADALFGKRTKVGDAHDRYANQEVSYLLQRIEDFNGIVILASNLKSNIDEAFSRRFQSIIHFPMPSAAERLQIWKNAFPKQMPLETGLTFEDIANNYELSGGAIMNIVRFVCLKMVAANSTTIEKKYILEAIKREIRKNTI